MKQLKNAYIYDSIRTPRGEGKSSGALYQVKPVDLLTTTLCALEKRNKLPTEQVSDAIIGCVSPVNGQGYNIAKTALLYSNWSDCVGGMQLNRFCTSGLEAINLAAVKIAAGHGDLIIAGGVESMSRVPLRSDGGALINDPEVINKVKYLPQGVAADLIASLEHFSREQLDEYALQSHQRASQAWKEGYFKNSIIPVVDQNELVVLDKDEHIRPNADLEGLAQLAPSFRFAGELGYESMALQKYPELEKLQYRHTAGNSSGMVDGAALVLIGSEEIGKRLDLQPRAKIRNFALAGGEPTIMLTGTITAAQKALERAEMSAKDIDLWECNEAFASVVLKFQQAMNINPKNLNVNGGSIAMGHPLGATGSILVGTLLDELERRDLKTGLVTLCAGGGMGVATIIERV
ncbi:MAG: acetyl-CoA C-acetyltransferase [Bacteroidota bacterium]